jgi:hypothetical protein
MSDQLQATEQQTASTMPPDTSTGADASGEAGAAPGVPPHASGAAPPAESTGSEDSGDRTSNTVSPDEPAEPDSGTNGLVTLPGGAVPVAHGGVGGLGAGQTTAGYLTTTAEEAALEARRTMMDVSRALNGLAVFFADGEVQDAVSTLAGKLHDLLFGG